VCVHGLHFQAGKLSLFGKAAYPVFPDDFEVGPVQAESPEHVIIYQEGCESASPFATN
jgi:hypothetical protein